MTDAAILATFSDFALVRSRKVARLIFEVPIEQAKTALDTLGMPDPAGETWCGIARTNLKTGPTPSLTTGPAKEGGGGQGSATSTPPPSKPNSSKAALMARNQHFQKYVAASSVDEAEAAIKAYCGVGRKRDLNDGTPARKFTTLRENFWRTRLAERGR